MSLNVYQATATEKVATFGLSKAKNLAIDCDQYF